MTVENAGNNETGELTITLSGTNSDGFVLSAATLESIKTGQARAFTVAPKTGLVVGVYSATVTVEGASIEPISINVSFEVEAAPPASYLITYKPGVDGTGDEATDHKTGGQSVKLAGAIFTRANYKQSGWSRSENGVIAYALNEAYATDADITLYPVWTAIGSVGGNVGPNKAGVLVHVMHGGESLGFTYSDEQGNYSFNDLPYGYYNVVAESEGQTATELIEINSSAVEKNIELLQKGRNTVAENKGEDTPPVAVDGLDEPYENPVTENENGVTNDDLITAAKSDGSVTVKFSVEQKTEGTVQSDANMLKTIKDENENLSILMDFSVIKSVSSDGLIFNETKLKEVPMPIYVAIEIPVKLRAMSGELGLLRVHEGTAERIPKGEINKNEFGEYYTVDEENGRYMWAYLRRFSTYTLTAPNAPQIQNAALPNGKVGTEYSQTLTASGSAQNMKWAVSNGTLPNGLSLSEGGLLSGTPTSAGSFTFTLYVSNNAGNDTKEYTIGISAATSSGEGGESAPGSAPVVPTVQPPRITSPVADETVFGEAEEAVTLSVKASGEGVLSYQWQIDRSDGKGWVIIEGAAGADYETSKLDIGNNGYRYRCVVCDAGGCTVSPVFTLMIGCKIAEVPATGGAETSIVTLAFCALAVALCLKRKKC